MRVTKEDILERHYVQLGTRYPAVVVSLGIVVFWHEWCRLVNWKGNL